MFLITQVTADGSEDHIAAKAAIQPLIDLGCAKEHRVMFCSTSEGKKSLVRQLSAELHIDTDPELISSLQRFMNKFHLIRPQAPAGSLDQSSLKAEATKLAKELPEKVIAFRSPDAYATKLLASFQQ